MTIGKNRTSWQVLRKALQSHQDRGRIEPADGGA
jgi:hypothetical protein